MMTRPEIKKYQDYVRGIKAEIDAEWDDAGGACDAINFATIHYQDGLDTTLQDHGFATYDDTEDALERLERKVRAHPDAERLERINHLKDYIHDDERFYMDNMFFYTGDGIEHLRALEEDELLRAVDEMATSELDAMKHCIGYVTASQLFADD